MPHATLIHPASLTIGRAQFLRGVRSPVTEQLARQLEGNPRFKVEFGADDASPDTRKPVDLADLAPPASADEIEDDPAPAEVEDAGEELDTGAAASPAAEGEGPQPEAEKPQDEPQPEPQPAAETTQARQRGPVRIIPRRKAEEAKAKEAEKPADEGEDL
jgi:hypothetical protein